MATNPLEALRRAWLTGPMFTRASSGPSQWAGRTTLNSGSATIVVSTFAVKSDSLIRFGIEGNAKLPILAGQVTITSGTSFATVSNAAFAADSLVQLTIEQAATGAKIQQNSGFAQPVEVMSLGAGSMDVGFAVQSLNPRADDTVISYLAMPADGLPSAIEVRSISDSNYFILGRADGVAIARDSTIMWMIEKTNA